MSPKILKIILALMVLIIIGSIIYLVAYRYPGRQNIFGRYRPPTWKQLNDKDNIYFQSAAQSGFKLPQKGKYPQDFPFKCNVLRTYGLNQDINTLYVVCKDNTNKGNPDWVFKMPQKIIDNNGNEMVVVPDDDDGIINYNLDGTITPSTSAASCKTVNDPNNKHFKATQGIGLIYPTVACSTKSLRKVNSKTGNESKSYWWIWKYISKS